MKESDALNQLLLLRLDAEGLVPTESLTLFDQAIKNTSAQLKALGDLEAYAEKQMEMGTALDIGEARSLRA
jgi:uncharacterized protein involved in propanediol utilization